MKKTLFLLASAALLFAGCAKEQIATSANDGESVEVSFTAMLENSEYTKAAIDNDGAAAKVNHWIMEVRDSHNDLFTRMEKLPSEVTEGSLTQTFNLKLFKNQAYTIQFWADTKGAYDTDDLTAISTIGSVANQDSRDAFSANVEYTSSKSESKNVTLSRPFGQLNIITNDLDKMKEEVVPATYAKFAPANLEVTASIPTTFNVQTQKAGAASVQTLTAGASYADFLAGAANTTLFMDYIFASADENDIVNFAFSFLSDGNPIAYEFTSIPMRRNYRTNIKGQLLSNDSQWTVTIDKNWTGELNPEYVVEGSVAAAIQALKDGKTIIEISAPADYNTPVAIPAEANEKDISFNVTGVSGNDMTFCLAEGAQGPANLYLTTDAEDLVINLPNSHVEVNGGTYQTVEATTSANTLVVGKEVKIASLNVKKGNVKIQGIVDALTRANGVKAEMYASDRASLINHMSLAKSNETINLVCDIDLAGENWTPLFGGEKHFEATFDGQGNTISNLKVEDYTGTYIGFISHISGATIKNVTFKDAVLTNAVSNEGGRGAVIVGWSYAGVIDNCHVINASVTGGQKVAGIVGAISVEGAASLNKVTNCSVEGLTLSSNVSGDILYQAGALIGYIQLIAANPNGVVIENNSVKNITINDAYSGPNNTAWYSGTFIGSIIRKQQIDGQKIILNNNTISGTNNELFKTLYSSPYFGWTTNTENYSGAIAPIVIDGEEWKPVFYADAEGKYHVTNLDALKYFRDMVNGGKKFEGKTILLDADIDMAGEAWTPIGNVTSYPSISFDGIFDGQNHTIDNLSCTDNTQNYACAALFGSIYGTIQNLKMTNVNINSTHYAAAIAAYSSSSESKIINCSVIGGTITSTPEKINGVFDNGDKAGAIMGLNGEGGMVDNCYVEGVTITAYRDLGAIVGAGGVNKTTNNKAKECILTIDRSNYYGDKDVNANPIVGRNLGGTLNANNTAENVTVSIPANTADAIRAAVKSINDATSAGAYTITIANGSYELSDIAIAENAKNKTVTIKAAAKGGVTLKMNSDTKSKQIFLVDGYSGNNPTYSLIIDGIKFDLTAVTSGTASAVYAFMAGDPVAATIGYTTSGPNLRYAHHITIQNCELVGAQGKENAMMFYAQNNTSPNNIVVKDSKVADAGYLFSGYCDTFTASNVTATNVRHFVNNQGNEIVVENCTVDCYTDYAVRANAGPVSITGSTFVMTYAGGDNGGVYVDRGGNTQLTMTGNTYPASYSGANMHDVYNEKNGACILNGSITLQNGESYDFPRE